MCVDGRIIIELDLNETKCVCNKFLCLNTGSIVRLLCKT
jgi:hypothetical protein